MPLSFIKTSYYESDKTPPPINLNLYPFIYTYFPPHFFAYNKIANKSMSGHSEN